VSLDRRRATVCLVTDRRRLCPEGGSADRLRAALLAQVREAAEAGVDLVHIRERDLHSRQLAAIVSDAMAAVVGAGAATRIVVNDRLDVALSEGAHGVHLRTDSIAPAAARSIAGPGFLIGRSVHDLDEALANASAVDYLIAGTLFPTPSKPSLEQFLGEERLATIARLVTVPVLAIGGVTVERLPAIARCGVAGIAAIGLFTGERAGGISIRAAVESVRAAFDTAESEP
jgi:thiamine-phosphate pyrophosphorylase